MSCRAMMARWLIDASLLVLCMRRVNWGRACMMRYWSQTTALLVSSQHKLMGLHPPRGAHTSTGNDWPNLGALGVGHPAAPARAAAPAAKQSVPQPC